MIKRLVVTGYKAHELGIFKDNHQGIVYIKKAIEKELVRLIEDGLSWVITSGQNGVELWSSEVVLLLKEQYPDIKLAIITPFLNQEENWKPEKKEAYYQILQQADFVDSIYKQPYQGPWQFVQKNKFLLKNSDGLLVLFDPDNEDGSPKYLMKEAEQYATSSSYEIMTITPYDLQVIVEEINSANSEGFY